MSRHVESALPPQEIIGDLLTLIFVVGFRRLRLIVQS
jgi:hypothetical protein